MQNLFLFKAGSCGWGMLGSGEAVCCGDIFVAALTGFMTTAMEIPIAATINTKKMGSSKTKFIPIGSTGIAVGPTTLGEKVVFRFGVGGACSVLGLNGA